MALTPYEWAVLDCLARVPEGTVYTDLWAAVWSANGGMVSIYTGSSANSVKA